MTDFKTHRQKKWGYIFKDWLISAALMTLLLVLFMLFSGKPFTSTWIFIGGAILLARLVEQLDQYRLYEIRFEKDRQQIVFLYKSFLTGSHQKTLSFAEARVETRKTRSGWPRREEGLSLYFFKGKKEIFLINKDKDGFSNATLHEICQAMAAMEEHNGGRT